MAGYNLCHFIGNIGKIDTRYVGNDNIPVSSLSIAVTERDKVNGQWTDVTTWLNCTLWRHENLLNHLEVGKQVHIAAKYKVREYEKDGEKRKSHEFNIETITLIGGKGGGDRGERQGDEQQQVRSMPRSARAQQTASGGFEPGITDDDVPF